MEGLGDKALDPKPENLSSDTGTHMVERENQLHCCPLTFTHVLWYMCTHIYVHEPREREIKRWREAETITDFAHH